LPDITVPYLLIHLLTYFRPTINYEMLNMNKNNGNNKSRLTNNSKLEARFEVFTAGRFKFSFSGLLGRIVLW